MCATQSCSMKDECIVTEMACWRKNMMNDFNPFNNVSAALWKTTFATNTEIWVNMKI